MNDLFDWAAYAELYRKRQNLIAKAQQDCKRARRSHKPMSPALQAKVQDLTRRMLEMEIAA